MERLVLLNDRAGSGEYGKNKQQKYDQFQGGEEIPYLFRNCRFFCLFVLGHGDLVFANKKALLQFAGRASRWVKGNNATSCDTWRIL